MSFGGDMRGLIFIIFCLELLFSGSGLALSNSGHKKIDTPVIKYRDHYSAYDEFCQNNSGECDLSGPEEVVLTPELFQLLDQVNRTVNHEIAFVNDPEYYGLEEFWTYPQKAQGDCEDFALEKRRRLVMLGVPRGALRMMTAFHRTKFFAHALLSVETDKATLILDQETDELLLWSDAPYIYASRELPDGRWEFFEQNWHTAGMGSPGD